MYNREIDNNHGFLQYEPFMRFDLCGNGNARTVVYPTKYEYNNNVIIFYPQTR